MDVAWRRSNGVGDSAKESRDHGTFKNDESGDSFLKPSCFAEFLGIG